MSKPSDKRWQLPRLDGSVAVVSGASRGAGRGIASVLGEAGATVYVTGRSSKKSSTTDDRPETIEQTAEQVSARGGQGRAARCDHSDEAEVQQLFERIQAEEGKIDILINNAWAGYVGYDDHFADRFWRQPFAKRWSGMFESGVRAHLLTTFHALPLMMPQKRGLIVSTVWWNQGTFLGTCSTTWPKRRWCASAMAFPWS